MPSDSNNRTVTSWVPPIDARNVVEVFRQRAQDRGEEVAYTFLVDGESETVQRTYAEADRWARAIAARLQQLGAAGQRALLLYEPGLDYVAALTACFYAGVIAVPAYPPDPMRMHRTLPRLQKIVQDSQASLLLTTSATQGWCEAMFANLPGLQAVLATDQIDLGLADRWSMPDLGRDDLALLQYTSGSTGSPKGVMISHGNALGNMAQIHAKLDHPDNVLVSWLPMYHDMGLILILQGWYSRRRVVMMSPLSFFQQPIRWLRAISAHRGSVCAAPNFAYDLCVRKVTPELRASLDLSGWALALNGSEPVRPETLDRFVAAFGPCGVRREIFCPCYGMAETTLMIAGSRVRSAPVVASFDAAELENNRAVCVEPAAKGARRLVGCGTGLAGEKIAIVDPQSGVRLSEGQVGEIWVSGPNVARGYWGRPQLSAETFQAKTSEGEGPLLRTGDLGFVLDGNLFVAGRLKDLIIFCGSNHYPQDIEMTVERCHPDLKAYGGAVFAIDDGQSERVVVVHEVGRPRRVDLEALLETIRRRVGEEHQIPVDAVVLIRQGSIPKTSSGKIRRSACRESYLAGTLDVLAQWRASDAADLEDAEAEKDAACNQIAGNGDRRESGRGRNHYAAPQTETQRLLADIWAEVLGVPRVGIHDDFFALGGNSLLATQLISRLTPHVPVEIPLTSLFDRPTVAALAECIDRAKHESGDAGSLAAMLESLESMSEEEAQRATACDDRLETTANAARPGGVLARSSAECVAGPAQQRSRERLVHETAR